MVGRLADRKAVVLGAANQGNMGQVIAKRLRDEGAAVVVAGRKMGELERFAAEIGGHALPCSGRAFVRPPGGGAPPIPCRHTTGAGRVCQRPSRSLPRGLHVLCGQP